MNGNENSSQTIINPQDLLQKPTPVYYSEQIDQLILTPEGRATSIIRKKPKIIQIPVYLLDSKGQKIPLKDEEGNILLNEKDEIRYIIKEYIDKQDGWESELDIIPASEIFNIDNATSNISHDAVRVLLRLYWFYNYLVIQHMSTQNDYSLYLHKIRNDALSILQSSKSYNGGTVQAIKTFINKTDTRQWVSNQDEPKKPNPLSFLFGGNKKPESKEKSYTAYQQ